MIIKKQQAQTKCKGIISKKCKRQKDIEPYIEDLIPHKLMYNISPWKHYREKVPDIHEIFHDLLSISA